MPLFMTWIVESHSMVEYFIVKWQSRYVVCRNKRNCLLLNNNDVVDDDEIIFHVLELEDAYGYSFVIYNDLALSHKHIPRRFDLKI